MVVDIFTKYGLRDRVKLIASGKLITPAEVAWAYCSGADMVVSARGFMLALGCIQAMRCNKNTCPTGITTHDRRLQKGLDPEEKSVWVKAYAERLTQGVGIIAHSCGVPNPRALKRFHCRIVQDTGLSMPLDELYPLQKVLSDYAKAA
jgi:glutamate synthase domain-containing protein 2